MAPQLSQALEICLHSRRSAPLTSIFGRRRKFLPSSRSASALSNYTTRFAGKGSQRSPQDPLKSDLGDPFDKLDGLLRVYRPAESEVQMTSASQVAVKEPYHLHVYSTKHNTHIVWTRPNRDPIISKSAGNLNFKKAQRGKYDAAYQLSTYVMTKMQERGLADMMGAPGKETGIELVFRGFGQGREAFTKALMSPEGRVLKDFIVRVTDATRLKFGGTRSRNVRRL